MHVCNCSTHFHHENQAQNQINFASNVKQAYSFRLFKVGIRNEWMNAVWANGVIKPAHFICFSKCDLNPQTSYDLLAKLV